MKSEALLSFDTGQYGSQQEDHRLESLPKTEFLSEGFITQRILFFLGGDGGIPIFGRVSPSTVRTRRCVYPVIFEVSKELRIAHLSSAAIYSSLKVFTKYGSAAYLLKRFLDRVQSNTNDYKHRENPGSSMPPSLTCLLNGHKRIDVPRDSWGGPSSRGGFLHAIFKLWNDWRFVLVSLHAMLVSSLHRTYCGMELIPSQGALNLLLSETEQEETTPFITLYQERFNYRGHKNARGGNFTDCDPSDFKLTLLSLEHHLRPFLGMIDGLANLMELFLTYMHRNNLSMESAPRVLTMLLCLQMRTSEHGQTDYVREMWNYIMKYTLASLDLDTLADMQPLHRIDRSWRYIGASFCELAQAQIDGDLGHSAPHQRINFSMDNPGYERQNAHAVLKSVNDAAATQLQSLQLSLHSALHHRYNLLACLSYLIGICCLRFGNSLDRLFGFVTTQNVPRNYHPHVKDMLKQSLIEYACHSEDGVFSELTEDGLLSITDMFEYFIDIENPTPNMSLRVTKEIEPISAVISGSMTKYNAILEHLMGHQSFYQDVKVLITLSTRTNGSVSGFYIPRASIPLLRVANSLGEYYRYIVNSAWGSFVSALGSCRSIAEVANLHEEYLYFMLQALLVPMPKPQNCKNTSDLGSLFSENIATIKDCAFAFKGLLTHDVNPELGEIEHVNDILKETIGTMKAKLNVLCSLSMPGMKEFGHEERAIIREVVTARVDLRSNACRALYMLQRLLA